MAPQEPGYPIEQLQITSVEHPFVVKNVEKAIDTLGGPSPVMQLVAPETTRKGIDLLLNPDDPMDRPITSGNVPTENLLLKIQVPRLTGRKRKRGSDVPFHGPAHSRGDPPEQNEERQKPDPDKASAAVKGPRHLIRRLAQSQDHLQVSAIGPIAQTHRFRVMPDFVFSTSKQGFMNRVRNNLLPMDYEAAKGFRFDNSRGTQPMTELIPPPEMSHFILPFNYSYHQNPSVRPVVGKSGEIVMQNESVARKVWTERLPWNSHEVPSKPTEGVPPVESLGEPSRRLLKHLQSLMNQRPIWTRRALANQLKDPLQRNLAKHLYQHLGYSFRSGPWREAIIKYGIDPRTDPKYRVWQTIMLQTDEDYLKEFPEETRSNPLGKRGGKRNRGQGRSKDGGLGRKSHVFDGKIVGLEGKIWQVCDITDPLLASIFDTPMLRRHCHAKIDGWYHNGTWAKGRIIFKNKVMAMISKEEILKDAELVGILGIPDIIEIGPPGNHAYPAHSSSFELDMAAKVRNTAATPEKELFDSSDIDRADEADEANEAGEDAESLDEESGDSSIDTITGAGPDLDDLASDADEEEEEEEEEEEDDDDDVDEAGEGGLIADLYGML